MTREEVTAIIDELQRRAFEGGDPKTPIDYSALQRLWDRNPPCPDCGGFDHFECP